MHAQDTRWQAAALRVVRVRIRTSARTRTKRVLRKCKYWIRVDCPAFKFGRFPSLDSTRQYTHTQFIYFYFFQSLWSHNNCICNTLWMIWWWSCYKLTGYGYCNRYFHFLPCRLSLFAGLFTESSQKERVEVWESEIPVWSMEATVQEEQQQAVY
jgi:hypothetical protein